MRFSRANLNLYLDWRTGSLSSTGWQARRYSIRPDSSESKPSRLCAVLTRLLGGVAAAQLAGCATTPARPDPASYLAHCPPEAAAPPSSWLRLPGERHVPEDGHF